MPIHTNVFDLKEFEGNLVLPHQWTVAMVLSVRIFDWKGFEEKMVWLDCCMCMVQVTLTNMHICVIWSEIEGDDVYCTAILHLQFLSCEKIFDHLEFPVSILSYGNNKKLQDSSFL